MSTQTLMLTPWMAPHRVISWQRAIVLLYLGKVEVLEEYEYLIRSVTLTIRMPAVVRLLRAVRGAKRSGHQDDPSDHGFRLEQTMALGGLGQRQD